MSDKYGGQSGDEHTFNDNSTRNGNDAHGEAKLQNFICLENGKYGKKLFHIGKNTGKQEMADLEIHQEQGQGQHKTGEVLSSSHDQDTQNEPELYGPEHDNYIFIKFNSGKDESVQLSKGKSHFPVTEEPIASGSQRNFNTMDSRVSVETLPYDDGMSDLIEDVEFIDDLENDLENSYMNPRLQIYLRDLLGEGNTDNIVLQYLQGLDPLHLDQATRHLLHVKSDEPLYPCNKKVKGTCDICLAENIITQARLCCNFPVCEPCLKEYLKNEVNQRNIRVQCINCDSYVHRDEILALLPTEDKEKYYKYLLEENKDSNIKTCPRCSFLQNKKDIVPTNSASPKKGKKKKKSPSELKVLCSRCGIAWCFDCHAPWHENMKCRDFQKGDKLVKNWAKEFNYGVKNAVRCPKCKIFIHKRGGCDHMTCRYCKTNFCYRCGNRYIQMKLIGKHSDRFSPFGCKYNLLPDNPVPRKALRGTIFGAKIFGGVLLGGLIVAAAAVFIGGSIIFVPTYFGIRYYHRRQRQRFLQSYRRNADHINKRIMQAQRHIATNTVPVSATALQDVELGIPYIDHSDTLTSTESSSSNDHHGSTEVKVWVHSENEEKQVDVVKYKSQEQQTTPGNHDNTVTTAEVTMEDDLVVLHVKTTSKVTKGEVSSEQELDGSKGVAVNMEVKKTEDPSVGETDKGENGGEETVDTQGCFVKILGKLPVKWEKEEEKEVKFDENVTAVKPAIVKEKKRRIGTRRHRNLNEIPIFVESEKSNHVDSLEKPLKFDSFAKGSEIQKDKLVCDDIDPYLGVVSMETCDTVF